MKQASNNEIDLVLKALGKRGQSAVYGAPRSDGDNGNISNHLDADELNSYAEGVVPGLARERYTQHLAACDRCRGIVITLSQSAGAGARSNVEKLQTGSGFWSILASIFSPAVLRFAVPVLVITAVFGVGFLTLRQRGGTALVARNEGVAPAPSPESKMLEAAQQPSVPANIQPSPPTGRTDLYSFDSETKSKPVEVEDRSAVAKAPSEVGAVTKSGSDQLAAAGGEKANVAQPKYAPEPSVAPPPRPSSGEADKAALDSRDLAKEREERQRQEENFRSQTKDEASGPNRARSDVSGRRGAGLSGSGPQKAPEALKRKADDEPETRTVAGRRFRREGNGWVDTSYEYSRATINVARGSEQYRALVADEPGLRAIADQLGGEVIVVWKGKAYRFR